MKKETGGADAAQQKDKIEKSVLAYCGQAGLFPPVEEAFPDQSGNNGSTAVFGKGRDKPRHVVVAVSGGADSMALLNILLALAPALRLYVTACHVNHGMRGETADRDEAFVRTECARLGVPLDVCSAKRDGVPVPPDAGEDWARKLRYGYFQGYAAEGNVLVATAHTVSDQAETLLFRLARGTGAHGAAGIRPVRGLYVRPLLCLKRQDTETYCRAIGQRYITDETNLKDAYARNRIRHTAVPALETVNAGAVRNMGAFCAKMARVDAYFAARAETLLQEAAAACGGTPEAGPWKLETLRAADSLVRETALHGLVSPVRDAEEKYIRLLEELTAAGSGAVQLTEEVRFCVKDACLMREKSRPVPPAAASCAFTLAPGEWQMGKDYALKIEVLPAPLAEKTQSVHKKDLKNVADYAKIPLLSVLRTRMPGDCFRPMGRGVGKTLKKWQNEQKIPQPERGRQPLLAAGSRVLWLWGCGFADGLAPEENTKEVLRITPLAQAEESES